MNDRSAVQLHPDDEANRRLLSNVHPADWQPPAPKESYQLVVIGGGPAGLVAAFGAAGLGARVALVEKGLLGGDCLNSGCVPSKALISSAHAAHAARSGEAFGVSVGDVRVDFGRAMQRMRELRADISPHDAATRLRDAGIDVFLGHGTFTGRDTLEVGGATLRFKRAVIATGAKAARPPIPGIDEVAPLDNEGLFELTELPARIAVLGSGPIGAEMAQTFRRFGAEVTVIDRADHILPREDPDAAAVVQAQFVEEGIELELGAAIVGFEREGDAKVVVVERDGETSRVVVDEILMALGRRPNMNGLGLEAAGVASSRTGIVVDDFMRTSNPAVYAAGDVASRFQFTHAADAMARIVLQNALVFPSKKASSLVIPWATYTYPEVAHVGPTADELAGRHDLQVLRVDLSELDRGVCDGETEGFCKVHADSKGNIVACTIVACNAGDLINEASVAMTHGITLGKLASTIHAYPTQGELLWKVANLFNKTRFSPSMKAWASWLLKRRLG
jgi:pyruvate/2-oxoglutarate dehydrogenase complex dihydrolipoamide dehydrogenase (E3) component